MDVHCSSCGEPWDVHHLRHDAIYDTDLDRAEVRKWAALPAKKRLSSCYREKFKEAGWEFGSSLLHVKRCPCCPKSAKPNPEKEAMKAALGLMGTDQLSLTKCLITVTAGVID